MHTFWLYHKVRNEYFRYSSRAARRFDVFDENESIEKKPSVIAVMEWPTSMDEFSTSSSNIDVIFGSIIKFESSTFDTNQQRPENSKIWVRTRRFKNLTNVIGGTSPTGGQTTESAQDPSTWARARMIAAAFVVRVGARRP